VTGPTELERAACALADAVEASLAAWVQGCVRRLLEAWSGRADPEVMAAAARAGERAAAECGRRVRHLLSLDIDQQRTTPLSLVREAVAYPTEVLAAAGVPPVERDSFARQAFPDDPYGLSPASFAELGPEAAEAALVWGAAKAMEHKRRHGTGRAGR
jgi:hypothetical protein